MPKINAPLFFSFWSDDACMQHCPSSFQCDTLLCALLSSPMVDGSLEAPSDDTDASQSFIIPLLLCCSPFIPSNVYLFKAAPLHCCHSLLHSLPHPSKLTSKSLEGNHTFIPFTQLLSSFNMCDLISAGECFNSILIHPWSINLPVSPPCIHVELKKQKVSFQYHSMTQKWTLIEIFLLHTQ